MVRVAILLGWLARAKASGRFTVTVVPTPNIYWGILAGSPTGASGNANGTGTSATFSGPNGMVRDKLNFVKYHVGKKADASELFLSDATKSLEDKAVLSRVRDTLKACMSLDLLNKEIETFKDQPDWGLVKQ